MGVSKAFGYKVRCDIMKQPNHAMGDEPPEKVQCDETLLVLVPKHTGAFGGQPVINIAVKNGYSYDMVNKRFACPECFKGMAEESLEKARKPKTLLYGPNGEGVVDA